MNRLTDEKQRPRTFKDLPLCMKVKDVAMVLGVSIPVAYDLVYREDFPAVRVGRNENRQRIVIPRDRFLKWLYQEDYEAITGDGDMDKGGNENIEMGRLYQ